jgi:hypothetical protein
VAGSGRVEWRKSLRAAAPQPGFSGEGLDNRRVTVASPALLLSIRVLDGAVQSAVCGSTDYLPDAGSQRHMNSVCLRPPPSPLGPHLCNLDEMGSVMDQVIPLSGAKPPPPRSFHLFAVRASRERCSVWFLFKLAYPFCGVLSWSFTPPSSSRISSVWLESCP